MLHLVKDSLSGDCVAPGGSEVQEVHAFISKLETLEVIGRFHWSTF